MQRDRLVVTQDDKARWSRRVTRESNALDLEEGVFTWADPVRIARSLQASAEQTALRDHAESR